MAGYIIEFLNWRPVLWTLFVLFFMSYIVSKTTAKEWNIEYNRKKLEIEAIKA